MSNLEELWQNLITYEDINQINKICNGCGDEAVKDMKFKQAVEISEPSLTEKDILESIDPDEELNIWWYTITLRAMKKKLAMKEITIFNDQNNGNNQEPELSEEARREKIAKIKANPEYEKKKEELLKKLQKNVAQQYLEHRANKDLDNEKAKKNPYFLTTQFLFWEEQNFQENQDLIAQMFSNQVFQKLTLPPLIKEYKKIISKKISLPKGEQQEKLKKALNNISAESIQNLPKILETEEDEETRSWTKELIKYFLSCLIDKETLEEYCHNLFLQSLGETTEKTGKNFKEKIKKGDKELTFINTQSSVPGGNENKKGSNKGKEKDQKNPEETPKTLVFQECSGKDLLNQALKENSDFKASVENLKDIDFQIKIREELREIYNQKGIDNIKTQITNFLTQFSKENNITPPLTQNDIINEDDIEDTIVNHTPPKITIPTFEWYENANQVTKRINKTIKDIIENEQKRIKKHIKKQPENKIEQEINKETIANIIDEIKDQFWKLQYAKTFNINAEQGIKFEKNQLILQGNFNGTETNIIYDLDTWAVKISTTLCYDNEAFTFNNQEHYISLFNLKNFKEYQTQYFEAIKENIKQWKTPEETKIESETINNKGLTELEMNITKNELYHHLLEIFKNTKGETFDSITKINDPDLFQFYQDINDTIKTPEDADKMNQIITDIEAITNFNQGGINLQKDKEQMGNRESSQIITKLFNNEKLLKDKENLNEKKDFSTNSIVLLLKHFIRRKNDQEKEFRFDDIQKLVDIRKQGTKEEIQKRENNILGIETNDWEYQTYQKTDLSDYLKKQ